MSSPSVGDGAGAQTTLPTHFNTPSQIQPQPVATDPLDTVWRWRAGLVAKIDIVNQFILILRTSLYLAVVDYSCINLPCTLPGPSFLHWFYLHERGNIIVPLFVFAAFLSGEDETGRKSRVEPSDAIKWYIIPYLIFSAYTIILSSLLWRVSIRRDFDPTCGLILTIVYMENIVQSLVFEILVDCYTLYTLASENNPANAFVEIFLMLLSLTYMGGSFFVVYMFWQELRLRRTVQGIMGMGPAFSQPLVVQAQPVEMSNSTSPQPFGMEEYAPAAYPRQQQAYQTLNSSTPQQS